MPRFDEQRRLFMTRGLSKPALCQGRHGWPVTDSTGELVEPLLPKRPRRPKGGRPPANDRAALSGILSRYVRGFPGRTCRARWATARGGTCWRRLRDWQRAGVGDRLHRALLSAHSDTWDPWSKTARRYSRAPGGPPCSSVGVRRFAKATGESVTVHAPGVGPSHRLYHGEHEASVRRRLETGHGAKPRPSTPRHGDFGGAALDRG